MKTKPQPPTHDAIAGRARQLWEVAGRPAGRDEEFWLSAEQLLRTEVTPPPLPPAPPPAVPQSPAHEVPPVLRDVVQPVARPRPAGPARKRGSR